MGDPGSSSTFRLPLDKAGRGIKCITLFPIFDCENEDDMEDDFGCRLATLRPFDDELPF
jgi:hypothetical protein